MRFEQLREARLPVIAAFVLLAAAGAIRAEVCGTWAVTANPIIDGVESIPTMIVPFFPSNAVGLSNVNAGGVLSVAHVQWDGTGWTLDSVNPIDDLDGGTGWNMRAVVGTEPDDLWATGLAGLDNFHGVPFLAHYDGVEWTAELGTIFEDPNPQAGDPIRTAEGSALVVFAPNDIWVLGAGEDLEKTVSNPIACHWDGSNIEEVGTIQPLFTRSNLFEDGDGTGPDSLWIVGYGRNVGGVYHLLTHHWDGTQWSPVTAWTPLPGQNILQDFLYDVVAFAPNDVWAFGKKTVLVGGTTESVSFYLHWNGTGWTEVVGPDIGPLTSAAGAAPDDIWVSDAFGEFGGRMAHWDGVGWTEVQTASIPGATHIGLTNLAMSAGCNAWAVGYWAIYDGMGGWEEYHALIEHLSAAVSALPGDIDGNGVVDMGDVEAFANVLIGLDTDPGRVSASDFNGDGQTNGMDTMAFAELLLGE